MGLTAKQDAFGRALRDQMAGEPAFAIIERDDGFVDLDGVARYFDPPAKWAPFQRRAVRAARGRVLDIGCGAGRVALELQARGQSPVGIDVSPGAIAVARERGVRDARLLSIMQTDRLKGLFDSIVMAGNNFGLFGSAPRTVSLMKRFHAMTEPDARLIVETLDPYATDVREHLRYHARNRARGRMSGQIRLRVRYRAHATPWFDYLFVSREELEDLAERGGWTVAKYEDDGTPLYAAVMEKSGS